MRLRIRILCVVVLFLSFVPYAHDLATVDQSTVQISTTFSTMSIPVVSVPSTTSSTTTTTIPPTTTSMASTYQAASSPANDYQIWDTIARCETPPDGNWGARGGSFEGGLQFLPQTWHDYVAVGKPYGLEGFPAHAYDASREQQIVVAIRVRDGVKGSSAPYLNPQGWNAWPTCRHDAGV